MQQGKDHKYRNVFHGMYRIAKDEGFTALWTGTVPAALRAALLTSSQLATYDQRYVDATRSADFLIKHATSRTLIHLLSARFPNSKMLLKRTTGLEEGLPAHFGAAMTAGLLTTTVSTPADLVKSVVMNSKPRLQLGVCVRHIFREEGFRGFMRGWTANYARLGPHTLLTVLTYENLRTALGWKNL